jgi:hypothetical protein
MVRTPREKDAAAAAGGSGRTGAIRAGWPYVLLLVLLGAGLVAVHLGFGNAARRDFQKLLSTMADQQRAAIEAYLDQRIADAAVFAAFPTVRAAVAPNEPLSGELEEHLATVLQAGRTEWGSVAVQVLDAEGAVRAGSGPELPEAAALLAGAGERAVVVALVGEGEGARLVVATRVRAPDGSLRGWFFLVDDPSRSLWEILRREPITSRTGEAFLVAYAGGSPAFLSPLRGLSPGVRPAPEALAAAVSPRAGRWRERSFGEFVDYRGEKVWAAVRRIARTRWGLVVKIDRTEALHGLASGRRWASLALVSSRSRRPRRSVRSGRRSASGRRPSCSGGTNGTASSWSRPATRSSGTVRATGESSRRTARRRSSGGARARSSSRGACSTSWPRRTRRKRGSRCRGRAASAADPDPGEEKGRKPLPGGHLRGRSLEGRRSSFPS